MSIDFNNNLQQPPENHAKEEKPILKLSSQGFILCGFIYITYLIRQDYGNM
jgi:hypothetical protein